MVKNFYPYFTYIRLTLFFCHSFLTKDFDHLVAWLGERLSKTDVAELMMIDWETVGRKPSITSTIPMIPHL